MQRRMNVMAKFLEKHRAVSGGLCNMGGVIMYALALNLFLAPNDIAAGGLSGIATALSSIVPVKISLLILVMNIPLIILGVIVKGWQFTKNTIIGSLLYTGAVELFSYLPPATGDTFVAMAFGGIMYGVGTSLLVRGNGSTGGTDILIRVVNVYFPNISIGKAGVIVDGATVVLAMVVYGKIEVGLYAILTIYISSLLADKMLTGFDMGTLCIIITSKPAEHISNRIICDFERSVTKLDGIGMYTKGDKNVLMAAVRPTEMPKLKRMISEEDPEAFMVVMPATEILGEGFKAFDVVAKLP